MIGDPTAFTRGFSAAQKPTLADIVRLSMMKKADERREQEFQAQQPVRDMAIKSEQARLDSQEEEEKKRKRISYISELAHASWDHGDREGLKKHILELSSIDPDHARKVRDLYWEVDGDTVKQATLEAFSSIVLPEKEIEAKNKVLDTALETIDSPNHFMTNILGQLRSMPAGKKRNAFEVEFIKKAKELGLLPGASESDEKTKYQQVPGTYLIRKDGKLYRSTASFDPYTTDTKEILTQVGEGLGDGETEFLQKDTGLTPSELSKIKVLESTTKEEEKYAIKFGAKFAEQFIAMSKIKTEYNKLLEVYDEAAKGNKKVGTGALQQYLPSVKKESVLFDNLRKSIGLTILSAHTFGALSENEMKFILQSAVPYGLKGSDLREWIVNRKAAIQNLMAYYKKAADFIGSRNTETGDINTVNDWMKLGKNISPFSLKDSSDYFNKKLNESAKQPVNRPEVTKDELRKLSGEDLTKKILESIGE